MKRALHHFLVSRRIVSYAKNYYFLGERYNDLVVTFTRFSYTKQKLQGWTYVNISTLAEARWVFSTIVLNIYLGDFTHSTWFLATSSSNVENIVKLWKLLSFYRLELLNLFDAKLTSTLSPYKLSLWFSLLKTCAGYLLRALQAISSANMRMILSSGIPSRFTVLNEQTKKQNKSNTRKTLRCL